MRLGYKEWLRRIVAGAMVVATVNPAEGSRVYHPIPLSVMAAEDPAKWSNQMYTHVEIDGWVTFVRQEGDGDIHMRICDSPRVRGGMNRFHCIVAETIPSLKPTGNLAAVGLGKHVVVRGISRFDAEVGHRFWEIHPVEQIEVIK